MRFALYMFGIMMVLMGACAAVTCFYAVYAGNNYYYIPALICGISSVVSGEQMMNVARRLG